MLTSNFLIAYRSLLKNKIFSYINILGLAIGMAAFLLISQYVRYERSYEDFQKHGDDIFRITTDFYNGAEYVMTDCETYAPVGPLLKEEFPEVKEYVRMYGLDGLIGVRAGEISDLESGLYWADHAAFDVFTYHVIEGDARHALTAPFEAVLTETMARKYFGRVNVVDEMINAYGYDYRVKAVIADLPPNTHLKFSILLSRLSLKTLKPGYPDDNWNNNNEFTYVLTQPGTDLAAFNSKLKTLVDTKLREKITQEMFTAERIRDIHLYSNKSYEPEPGGNATAVYYFSIIAVFMVVIAWVNYVNLATARAVERAREVGIRKVMGSLRIQLVLQFLSESLLTSVLAGGLAVILCQTAFPFFKELSGMPLQYHLMQDTSFWISLGVLVLAGSVLAGAYPAFVLSSFRPVAVLKGKFRSTGHGQLLRKGLVVFQFGATLVLIISMSTIFAQLSFLRNHDLGMSIDQTLVLSAQHLGLTDSAFQSTSHTFKTELQRDPRIMSVARTESLPGVDIQELSTTSMNVVGQTEGEKRGYLYYFIGVDADFVPALNLTIAKGRNFEGGLPNHDAVLVNEEAARLLGFTDPETAVGAKVSFITRRGADGSTIIGVLKDFYFRSPKEAKFPMLFYYKEPSDYFALKVNTDDMPGLIASVKSVWNKVYPTSTFRYFFLDDKYDMQYRSETQFGEVMATFSVLIVIIACLGLFGLSSYSVTQRTKEIGIRKVLGASAVQIVRLLSGDFARIVLIASLIALPCSFLVMQQWLASFPLRVDLSIWIFAMPVLFIVLVAAATVSVQTVKTALSNPSAALRQE